MTRPPPRPRKTLGGRRQAGLPASATRGAATQDAGNAVIEFIFVALLVLVPLVYLTVAVAGVQRGRLALTDAARDVGRAIASTPSGGDVDLRASAALRIALASQGLAVSDVDVRYVTAGASCQAEGIEPALTAGAEFAVCVIGHRQLPGIPSIVAGRAITLVGRYVVHLDEFRTAP
jgi:Flp pilus assembly protein TadG